jgi:hypothetical protein
MSEKSDNNKANPIEYLVSDWSNNKLDLLNSIFNLFINE